jgi:hypothetical protein
MRFTFSSDADPVHCIQLSLYSANQDGLMVKPDVAVFDEKLKEVPFRIFPMRDVTDPSRRCLGIFFTPPVKRNERFTVRFRELPRLLPKELNELTYMPQRAFGKAIEHIEMVLHYPQEESVDISRYKDSPEGSVLPPGRTNPHAPGFKSIGWEATNVVLKEAQSFGFWIHRAARAARAAENAGNA